MENILFMLSKVFGPLLSPAEFFILFLTVGIIFLWFLPKKLWAQKLGKVLVSISALFFLLICFFPFDQWIIKPLESAFSVPDSALLDDFDGVIVLGGEMNPLLSVDNKSPITPWGSERLNAFIHLYQKKPHAKYVFTGGSGGIFDTEVKEATWAQKYFEYLGVNTESIIFEDKSRNTYENAVFTKELVNPQPHEKWILITSAYHMPRSVGIFNKVGWKVIPFPVGHRSSENYYPFQHNFSKKLYIFSTAFHEWFGLFSYWILGRTDTLFPKKM